MYHDYKYNCVANADLFLFSPDHFFFSTSCPLGPVMQAQVVWPNQLLTYKVKGVSRRYAL